MFSNHLKEYADRKYEERLPYLAGIREELEEGFRICTPEQEVLMRFFYGTMPLRDAGEYEFQVFFSFVKHAIWLREHVEWCAELPEDIFVNHVLYYRINSEDISENRAFFHEKLKDRIASCRNPAEAALAINYWCAENAAYEASDMRTASPMTVYRSGKGRCGEESTFAVTAFRSVGIPARQVYTPRWAHCDDNHAWVEVWLHGRWYFLGACEPEEILNKGWFSNASSRALLVHSRCFSDYTEEGEACIGKEGVTWFYNNTVTYARTKSLTVSVKYPDGKAAKGAEVSFEILNMAEYCSVAVLTADEAGVVRLTLGLGDIRIRAMQNGRCGEALVSAAVQDRAELTLDTDLSRTDWIRDVWEQEEVKAPADYPVNPGIVTPEQKQRRREKLAEANRLRERRINAYYDEKAADKYPGEKELLRLAAGNFGELYRFLERDGNPDRKALLHGLRVKDYKDADADVLEDALQYAGSFRETWEEDTYRKYLLCPCVYYEELTPYRSFIGRCFTDEQKAAFAEDPEKIQEYIRRNIAYEPEQDYRTICATPAGCLKLKQGNGLSRKILFVAICRTLGIPARINRVTQEAEYLCGDSFQVPGKREEKAGAARPDTKARLTLRAEDGRKWIYYQTWTIGRLDGMQFTTLDYEGIGWEGPVCRLPLEAGVYRLITTLRMPNGNQHASRRIFTLKEGEEKEIFMSLREAGMEDMLVRNEIPDFEVTDRDGRKRSVADIMDGGSGVFFFLEEGAEPTEHVLNELMARAEDWKDAAGQAKLLFILADEEALSNATVKRTLEKIPGITVVFDTEGDTAEPVARRMYVDPEKLPLLVVTTDGMTGIYGSSGYNVGSVDLIHKLL